MGSQTVKKESNVKVASRKAAPAPTALRAKAKTVVTALKALDRATAKVSEKVTDFAIYAYDNNVSVNVAVATLKDVLEGAGLKEGTARSLPTQLKAVLNGMIKYGSPEAIGTPEGLTGLKALAVLAGKTGTKCTVTACYNKLTAKGELRPQKKKKESDEGKGSGGQAGNAGESALTDLSDLSDDERTIVNALVNHQLEAAVSNAVRAALRAGVDAEKIGKLVTQAIANNS